MKCDGNPVCVKDSNFMMSTGDEAGSLLGVASNKIKGKAEFVNFSFDVKFEGKNVPRAMDLMLHNDKNTPPVSGDAGSGDCHGHAPEIDLPRLRQGPLAFNGRSGLR